MGKANRGNAIGFSLRQAAGFPALGGEETFLWRLFEKKKNVVAKGISPVLL
ncbi:MAG: hypothetical protein ACLS43_07920 [Evtepia gabavorous]